MLSIAHTFYWSSLSASGILRSSSTLPSRSIWNIVAGGGVVLDSLNMAYSDEDSILDQKYKKQIFSAFIYEDLKF